MARFVVAVSLLVVVSGSSCGGTTNRPDAGGTGGGLSGTGGGLSATGGGSAGGGSAAGGSAAGGNAGCLMVASVPAQNFLVGGFQPGDADAGDTLENFAVIGVLDADADAGIGLFAFNELYWDFPGTRPTFPQPFTLMPETYQACYNCFALRQCTLNLQSCATVGYLAQAGTGSWTAGTFDATRGSASGSASNVRYVRWDFARGADRAVDGGCIQIGSMSWNVSWAPPDGGVGDGGTGDGGM